MNKRICSLVALLMSVTANAGMPCRTRRQGGPALFIQDIQP